MLFTKYIALLALPILAVATPMPGGSPTTKGGVTTTVTVTETATSTVGASQCNTGDIQCCNSVQSASSPATAGLLGLLGIVVQDLSVLVGVTCTPISILGLGNGACSARPLCCENNNFNGLIAIGCVPINISL